jgi:nucleoside-diphosphate-sugar epimerase
MKLFITGHKGFIGKHLTKRLDDLGIEWAGYDLVDGNDIRDKTQLDIHMDKSQCDIIIHLAALTGVRRGEDYPQDYFNTNVIGTNNVLSLAKKFNIDKIIALSSSSVNKGNPKSIYGISKFSMEHVINVSSIKYKFIVRPFTVYGEEGRRDEILPRWIEQYKQGKPLTVYGDGTTFRTYLYVGDLIDAILIMLGYTDKSEVTFELGGNEKIYLSKMIEIFKTSYPDTQLLVMPLPACDSTGIEPDMTSAFEMGWFPKTNFENKMKEIIIGELKNGLININTK